MEKDEWIVDMCCNVDSMIIACVSLAVVLKELKSVLSEELRWTLKGLLNQGVQLWNKWITFWVFG